MLRKNLPHRRTRAEDLMAMYPTIRFGALAAVVLSCSFIVAQTTTGEIAPVTSALRSGQFDEALQLLQPELEQQPRNPQLWALRGIAFSGKGNKKEALGAFRHALTISPDYLPALEGAAQIEYDGGGKAAAPLLEHILKLRPGDPTSSAMLAVLDYRRGECATAIPHFEQGGSVVDSQPEAMQAYGDCLMKLKEIKKAIAVFSSRVGAVEHKYPCSLSSGCGADDSATSQRCHRDPAAVAARKHG